MKFLTKIQVTNSITNPASTTFDDAHVPYTLLQWVERASVPSGDADSYVDRYNDYVSAWRVATNQTTEQNKTTIRETYIRFLKEIEMKYLTAEEQRYFKNIDFNNPVEIDAAVPFFANRIRQIIKNIHDSRHQVKFQKIKYSLKGSSHGGKRLLFDTLTNFVLLKETPHDVPSIDRVVNNTRINVVEKYDIDQIYYTTDFKYTPGKQFVFEDGSEYIGYYHVVNETSGTRKYMTGKIPGDNQQIILPTGTGSLYVCDK